MKPDSGRREMPVSARLYGLLLRLYPASFRKEYADVLLQATLDLHREASQRYGLWGVVALWGRVVLVDFFATVGWEHLDAYERSRGMKKIIIQELFRALAVFWGVMILLALLTRGLGWGSGLILLLSGGVGLLSLIGFTIIRRVSGRELAVRTRKGWIVTGVILLIVILAINWLVYAPDMPVLDLALRMLISLAVMAAGIWWGLRPVKNSSQ